MKKRILKPVIGLLFVIGIALPIVHASAVFAPPQNTANATFSINWNQMPSDQENQAPTQARHEFDSRLAKFKVSQEFVSLLCRRCNIPTTQSASVEAKLRRYLKVVSIGLTNDCEFYRIQFDDNDQTFAVKAVNLLSRRFVARLNAKAKSHYTSEAVNQLEDNVKARDEEDGLRQELWSLSQQQSQGFSQERQGRIEQIKQELEENDIHKTVSGLRAFVAGVAIFSNPAELEQLGVVTKR